MLFALSMSFSNNENFVDVEKSEMLNCNINARR